MKKEIEYFLLISPPDRINEQINLLKRACAKHIGSFYSMKSKAHISLCKVIDEEDQPGQLSDIMQCYLRFAAKEIGQISPCNLKIDGFGYFTHGSKFRTIYAVINRTDEVTTWVDKLREKLLIDRSIIPHITIARKIPTEAFDILWPHFQKLTYKESFTADHLMVLSREFNKPYQPYRVFKQIAFDRSVKEFADFIRSAS